MKEEHCATCKQPASNLQVTCKQPSDARSESQPDPSSSIFILGGVSMNDQTRAAEDVF